MVETLPAVFVFAIPVLAIMLGAVVCFLVTRYWEPWEERRRNKKK